MRQRVEEAREKEADLKRLIWNKLVLFHVRGAGFGTLSLCLPTCLVVTRRVCSMCV